MKYLVLFASLAFFACNPPDSDVIAVDRYAHIQDTTARSIIKTSIEQAGGIDRWESMKKLTYTKGFSLLLESGEVEKEFRQVHDYQFDPLRIDITSTEN